jgi:hypothetical protein
LERVVENRSAEDVDQKERLVRDGSLSGRRRSGAGSGASGASGCRGVALDADFGRDTIAEEMLRITAPFASNELRAAGGGMEGKWWSAMVPLRGAGIVSDGSASAMRGATRRHGVTLDEIVRSECGKEWPASVRSALLGAHAADLGGSGDGGGAREESADSSVILIAAHGNPHGSGTVDAWQEARNDEPLDRLFDELDRVSRRREWTKLAPKELPSVGVSIDVRRTSSGKGKEWQRGMCVTSQCCVSWCLQSAHSLVPGTPPPHPPPPPPPPPFRAASRRSRRRTSAVRLNSLAAL